MSPKGEACGTVQKDMDRKSDREEIEMDYQQINADTIDSWCGQGWKWGIAKRIVPAADTA